MDSQPIQPNSGLNPLAESAGRASAKPAAASGNGPAFEALLEKLQAQAEGLRQKSEELSEPSQLASAVDMARSSLDDALSLSQQLLEAYRADVQKSDESQTGGTAADED
jgi:hypothetical protein